MADVSNAFAFILQQQIPSLVGNILKQNQSVKGYEPKVGAQVSILFNGSETCGTSKSQDLIALTETITVSTTEDWSLYLICETNSNTGDNQVLGSFKQQVIAALASTASNIYQIQNGLQISRFPTSTSDQSFSEGARIVTQVVLNYTVANSTQSTYSIAKDTVTLEYFKQQ